MNTKIFMIAMLSFGATCFASTPKVCFGSKSNDTTKGVVLSVNIDEKEIYIKTVKDGNGQTFGSEYYGGKSYPSLSKQIAGKDGKTYKTFKGEDSDYQDIILVDELLFNSGSSGLIQIRARGEGFFNSSFFCKDTSPRN